MLRRWWKRILGLAVLGGLAALFAVRALLGPSVEAEPVRRARLTQTVLVSGRVLPAAEVALTARAEAPALEVLVEEGDAVSQGQVLARFDRTAAEAEVARARAVLARAEAGLGSRAPRRGSAAAAASRPASPRSA